ncbi:MAG: hypothetical protein AAFV37_11605 [Pseudomonadota bacterium]
MTPVHQTLIGLMMILIGVFKTWLHVGAVPVLYLTTCTGNTIAVSTGPTHVLAQAHCWGCYLFLAGLMVSAYAVYRAFKGRRSVAYQVD